MARNLSIRVPALLTRDAAGAPQLQHGGLRLRDGGGHGQAEVRRPQPVPRVLAKSILARWLHKVGGIGGTRGWGGRGGVGGGELSQDQDGGSSRPLARPLRCARRCCPALRCCPSLLCVTSRVVCVPQQRLMCSLEEQGRTATWYIGRATSSGCVSDNPPPPQEDNDRGWCFGIDHPPEFEFVLRWAWRYWALGFAREPPPPCSCELHPHEAS